MILENHIRGRRRVLDPANKGRLCELISHESYTVEQAADSLDVSLRTIQRERKYDQDFDHEVRLALQSPPDPLKLMELAARTHWRAAAWLLERRNPEEFARKPINTTSPKKALAALRFVQEAALQAVPEEFHEALYRHTQAAMEQAFDNCFPMLGQWGAPKVKKLPFETPLADVQLDKVWRAQTIVVPDRTPPVDPRFEDRPEEYVDVEVATDLGPIEVSLPPEDYRHMQQVIAAAQARENILSPKTCETTKGDAATECVGWVLAPPSPAMNPAAPSLAKQLPAHRETVHESKPIKLETEKVGASTHPTDHLSPKPSAATELPPATKKFEHDPLTSLRNKLPATPPTEHPAEQRRGSQQRRDGRLGDAGDGGADARRTEVGLDVVQLRVGVQRAETSLPNQKVVAVDDAVEIEIARRRFDGAELHPVEGAVVPCVDQQAVEAGVDREGDRRDFAAGLGDAVAADGDAGHVGKFDGRHVGVEFIDVTGERCLLELQRERLADAGSVVEHEDLQLVELAREEIDDPEAIARVDVAVVDVVDLRVGQDVVRPARRPEVGVGVPVPPVIDERRFAERLCPFVKRPRLRPFEQHAVDRGAHAQSVDVVVKQVHGVDQRPAGRHFRAVIEVGDVGRDAIERRGGASRGEEAKAKAEEGQGESFHAETRFLLGVPMREQ